MALEIYLPRSYFDEQNDGRPRWYCRCCGETVTDQAHLGRCAREHLERIQEAKLEARIPIMDEALWDPEAADYLRNRAGRRMIEAVERLGVRRAVRDGHMEVRPNERAGG